MAEKRKKNPTFTSPKGTFKFPRLNEPDTKFKEEGEYSVKLVVNPDDAGVQELIEKIDAAAAECLEAAKDAEKTPAKAKKWETKYLPYADVEDDEGEPTGEIEFKFSMKASGTNKKTGKAWKRSPALFDAKGKPLGKDAPQIWGGTIGKVNFEIIPYRPTIQVGASVKLALNAAQIIDLVSGGGSRDASEYGFGEEEGYEAEDETSEGFEDETEDEDDDDEDPFT